MSGDDPSDYPPELLCGHIPFGSCYIRHCRKTFKTTNACMHAKMFGLSTLTGLQFFFTIAIILTFKLVQQRPTKTDSSVISQTNAGEKCTSTGEQPNHVAFTDSLTIRRTRQYCLYILQVPFFLSVISSKQHIKQAISICSSFPIALFYTWLPGDMSDILN